MIYIMYMSVTNRNVNLHACAQLGGLHQRLRMHRLNWHEAHCACVFLIILVGATSPIEDLNNVTRTKFHSLYN